ncbi:hypothetical protein [Amycolatopsis vancoresmycina]|uniref:Mce-associated membrane protein n=1 Tax=Amycolatopsis vancoresmycina DSM 44592 TaxID=1292037 RepID=R1G4Z9_9PSEU|nr:hypothetical protein [Amycolatopsis vancoresmycina]EOD66517.1 hypothetical protein H480_20987 [Amycolatopsis vancoresmycina DSM 44592]
MNRAKTVTQVEEVPASTGAVNANTAAGSATTGEQTALDGSAAESNAAASEPAAETGSAATTAESEAAAEATRAAASEPAAESEAAEPEAVESEAEQAEANRAEAEATETAPAEPRPAWRRLPALLLAAALVLAGAGVWFTLEARSTAATPAAANLALTDVGATADVTSAVTLAVNRIFSYSYDRTDVTEKAAAAVLRGPAKDSYDKLFAEVRRKAPEQKLVLTSRVSAIAVQELKNGHARLLVFLDQSAVRADNNATDTAAAQLSVTAEHSSGGWVITELEPR